MLLSGQMVKDMPSMMIQWVCRADTAQLILKLQQKEQMGFPEDPAVLTAKSTVQCMYSRERHLQ